MKPITHPFILKPGLWLGEGKIKLSMLEDELDFLTRWKVPQANKKGKINSIQEIQIKSIQETMRNQLAFFDFSKKNFNIELENQSFGKVIGKGLISEKIIGWEFRLNSLGFEGFEFYEATKDIKTYLMHAEYSTTDDFRTIIHGKIWKAEDQDA